MLSIIRRSKSGGENVNPNVQGNRFAFPSLPHKISSKAPVLGEICSRSQNLQDESHLPSDSSVKVIARIRPVSGHEREDYRVVRKVSSQSLSVTDRIFCFDSVFDSNSTQEDIFQLVGVPLVKNSLAGFNTSILSYGQTGSGKTYTMWGPLSAMVEGNTPNTHHGIVPRIFNMLFSEIQKDQDDSEGKLTKYHCRCSFLEIYNEQITDLLDPTHRNLQIRDDAKNGVYVENLTEEYVNDLEDVTLILIKGLSNRKVGATSKNSKSSRSHVILTCVIEYWSKGKSSKCISSSKSSKISFIDLAGSERNKVADADKESIKEARNVKQSLSRLGNLVNVLAEVKCLEKPQNISYRGSHLTHLLCESLGGNTKLTVICAVSPHGSCQGETLSTLRFGERAKSIQNKAAINEISEEDVNDLSDQIRQLKEELIKAKSNGSDMGYFKRHHGSVSLNKLRVSLNRSLILSHIENNEAEEEVKVDEQDVKDLCVQLENLHEESSRDSFEEKVTPQCSLKESSDTVAKVDSIEKKRHLNQEREIEELQVPGNGGSMFFHDPLLCESPKIKDSQRKSKVTSSLNQASSKFSSEIFRESKRSDLIRSSLRSSQMFPVPTESLAASLHRGLQIIDYHQRNSSSMNGFPFGDLMSRSCKETEKVDAGVQTVEEKGPSLTDCGSYLCASCKQEINSCKQFEESLNMWIAPVEEAETDKGMKNQLPKKQDEKNSSAEAIKREELEDLCAAQAAKIRQLNHLVEQYKQSILEQSQDTKSLDFEDPADEVIPSHDLITDVRISLADEFKDSSFDVRERDELLEEIQRLKNQLQSYMEASTINSLHNELTKGGPVGPNMEEIEMERQRWTETESRWICLTEELRLDLESSRRVVENMESELRSEKKLSAELDDALQRSILGHVFIVEHFTELQEKYNDLLWKHRKIMEGIAEVKAAAAKVGTTKGARSRFAESLAAELSALRVEREKEREYLKKENKGLRVQLRDTAEAVHAAGELLVRLREAEEGASIAQENYERGNQEMEKLKKQIEKLKRKHQMEMSTVKHYLAESRLPESALRPISRQDSDKAVTYIDVDDQDWRSEFGPSYREY